MRILVVDDSRTMRMLVIRTLRDRRGTASTRSSRPVTAWRPSRSSARSGVDIVLCDWNMPRMTGLELLRSCAAHGDLRLFGFVTKESSATMRGVAQHEGAAFVISKPFDAETFKSVFGGVDPTHAAIVHEGLPTARDLSELFAYLVGRPGRGDGDQASPSCRRPAAVAWSDVFPERCGGRGRGVGPAGGAVPRDRVRQ